MYLSEFDSEICSKSIMKNISVSPSSPFRYADFPFRRANASIFNKHGYLLLSNATVLLLISQLLVLKNSKPSGKFHEEYDGHLYTPSLRLTFVLACARSLRSLRAADIMPFIRNTMITAEKSDPGNATMHM